MKRSFVSGALACAVSLGIASATIADTAVILGVPSQSTENLGNFKATLDWQVGNATTGVLTVTLENTSAPANGGKITGFLFNINSADPNAKATLFSVPNPSFKFAKGNGMPFGMNYDAGSALGGNWQGGGNPNPGIGVGLSGVFKFNVTASDAASLTAVDFGADGPYAFNFVVRFRGFNDGGSDKVPGIEFIPPAEDCICPDNDGNPIDGDFDGDGIVDTPDLELMLFAIFACDPNNDQDFDDCATYDLDANGVVDGADLGLFLLCWRRCGTGA